MTTPDPAWLTEARKHVGLAEIPGLKTAPVIAAWLTRLRAWWHDDETPWCGVFVAAMMQAAGAKLPPHWMRARAWLDWGLPLAAPCVGCVVVFHRQGGGHVGFVVGQDQRGRLMVLGGNQRNRVSVAPFDLERVLGYRWPADPGLAQPAIGAALPVVFSAAAASANEA